MTVTPPSASAAAAAQSVPEVPRSSAQSTPQSSSSTHRQPSVPTPARASSWRRHGRSAPLTLALFALPAVAVIVGFHYLPLLGNVIAFKDYLPFLGIANSPWVGWQNFEIVTQGDPAFLNAVKNTLVITLVQSVFVFPAPILLALLLNSLVSERAKRIVQSITYLPHFLSWVIVVALFNTWFGGAGGINAFLRARGWQPLDIVGNADAFVAVLTSQVIWKDTGWAAILFLAALSQIDTSLYEASAVDGAGRLRQLWHITLPGLKSIIILLFILQLGSSLTVGFEQILLQQPAFGIRASEVIDTYVYNHGIVGQRWGEATAVGLVKGVIGVVLVLTANKVAHALGEDGVYRS